MSSTQFLPLLSRDFSKLLENGKNYDVTIKVGKGDDVKTFQAHSIILISRSTYFDLGLVQANKDEEDGFMLKLNLSPIAFDSILKYIYSGILDLDDLTGEIVLKLLVGCEELSLTYLVDHIQEYLIKNHDKWIQENFVFTHKICYQHDAFKKLQTFCTNLVCESPEILFESPDFTQLEESGLYSILKREDFVMKEIKVWDYLVQWGVAQNPGLPDTLSDWSSTDFACLKSTIANCVMCIRFFSISSEDFYRKIRIYATAIDVALYDEILQFHILKTYNPSTTQILPARKKLVIESKILSHEQAKLISTLINYYHTDHSEKQRSMESRRSVIFDERDLTEEKIKANNNGDNIQYNLLLRGSVDSFSPGTFHLRCDAKGPTITIFRLSSGGSGSQVILGGYTSENWLSLNEAKWVKCDESFLFSLKEKDTKSFKASLIKENQDAMYLDRNAGPYFSDLHLLGTRNGDYKKNEVKYSQFKYSKSIHKNGIFAIDEYEVFQVLI